jgi:MFS family permease
VSPAHTSLWKNANFMRLWVGQTISQVGSQFTTLALPLVAVLTLEASTFEMGLLTAAGAFPTLLAGLHAGALVDRRRRRPILIAGDLGRAALLALIPLAWALDVLSMGLLYAVALSSGLLSLFFDVAYQAFLPSVVPRDRLIDGNAKLALSQTVSMTGGPGLAGGLIQLLTAPVAIFFDACSYLGSALMIARIRVREPAPSRDDRAGRLWAEIREGLALVAGDRRLRALVGVTAQIGFFNAMLDAVFILYVARQLRVEPALLGAIFAVGNAGVLLGALLPERLARRVGLGPATAGAVALLGASDLLIPLAGGSTWVIVPLLAAAIFLFAIGVTVFTVNRASLRQAIVPGHLMGRATATGRVLATALVPLGALLGGLFGELIGLRATLVLAALGELLAALWLWHSPLRAMRELPGPAEEPTAAPGAA